MQNLGVEEIVQKNRKTTFEKKRTPGVDSEWKE